MGRFVIVLAVALLTTGCDEGPSIEEGASGSGRFLISNVRMEEAGPGTYEVTYDATWEGDLAISESPCDIRLIGPGDTLLGEGKERIEGSGTGLTTLVEDVEGVPERAEVSCPSVTFIP